MEKNNKRHYLKEKTVHGTLDLPIRIYHLDYNAETEHYFSMHWHEELEFIVVLNGGILYVVDNEEFPVYAGEGLFINANKVHSAKSLDEQPVHAIVVVFHPLFMNQSLHSDSYGKFVYPILHQIRYLPVKLSNTIAWQAEILEHIIRLDIPESTFKESELLIRGHLFQLWYLLYKNSSLPKADFPNMHSDYSYKIQRMKPVLSYIHTHFSEEITLATLIRILPMSKGQFCRSFKDVFGMTPISYVIQYRIEESCHLLVDTNLKVGEIARQVGFNTISYYNREFLKYMNISPSDYRRKLDDNNPSFKKL